MASSCSSRTSILLVSKTGNGKSSLANALLNTSQFQVGRGMLSSTAHCKCISTHARDRDLTVVDTPGTMDVEDEEKAKTEIRRAIGFCPQGFDIFLVVVKCDARFTAEERRAIEVVAEMFGDVFYEHAIVVFSHGDEFDNVEAEFQTELLETRKKIPYLDQLLTRCGNRFILVDNGRRCERSIQNRQIDSLLSMADRLLTSNGGKKYTSVELEAEKKRAEEEQRKKTEEAERRKASEEAERKERERLEVERRVQVASEEFESRLAAKQRESGAMMEQQMRHMRQQQLVNTVGKVLELGLAFAAAAAFGHSAGAQQHASQRAPQRLQIAPWSSSDDSDSDSD